MLMPICALANEIVDKELGEVVVTAMRWDHSENDLPIKVSSITFNKANEYNPQTMADVLSLSGEVFVQKSQYAGGSPMIRGFSANRLLYSIDGVRMNNAIFRSGNIQNVISLDAFSVGSTEIHFGPGAVGYGSDAIGGVMVFNTLRPQLSDSVKPKIFGSATIRTATASKELTPHLHFGVGFKKWSFLTSLTYSSFDDLKQGTHGPKDYVKPYNVTTRYTADGGFEDVVTANSDERCQSPSKYSQFNIMQKVRYAPSEAWNLEYAFHYSETSKYARYDRHLRMKDGMPRYAEWDYGPQKWMMNYLRVDNMRQTLLYDSFKLNFALQRFEESRISREMNNPYRDTQRETVDAYSLNADFKKVLTQNSTLYYGAEFVQNNVESVGIGEDITTHTTYQIAARYPKARWRSYGIFAQNEWDITDRLNLSTGLRYNHYLIATDFSTVGYEVPFNPMQNSNAGSISGNIGINWRLRPSMIFRANYARGFRAPNVDDMGKLFDSVDGCVTVPNPDLKPEYADNLEIGFSKSFGSFLKFDLSTYYTHLDNAIVRRDYTFNGSSTIEYQGNESRVQALQNAAEASIIGVQFAMDARFAKWWYADAHLNYQRGHEELDNGEKSPSRHAAPLFGRAAVGFTNTRLTTELFTTFQAECKAEDMPAEERDKTEIYALDENGNPYSPAWITLNLRASYRLDNNFTIAATLENITDRRYRPYSCGISAPGRSITLSLTYRL